MRRSLDALRQSFPNLIPVYVQTARPTAAWPTNGSVYQYTRFDTLRSMLGGAVIDTSTPPQPLRSLWATSSFHMNDSLEFVRGKDLLREAMAALPNDDITRWMQLALKDCNGLEVYCACFSLVPDDLSQWRGYGDNGAGVCLEFDLSELINLINGVGYWVIYGKPGDQATQSAVAAGLVTDIHNSIRTLLPVPTPEAVYREVREQLVEI